MKGTYAVHTFRSWLFRPRTLAGRRPISVGRLYIISRINESIEMRSRVLAPLVLSRVRDSIELNSRLAQPQAISQIEEFGQLVSRIL
jgi:hypothetical protein